MSNPKSYHPSGLSWRERQVQKERERKDADALAKEMERLKDLKINDDNFPSLGGSSQKPKPVTNSGMFAKLASEWREHDEIEKNREQSRRAQEEAERRRYVPPIRIQRMSPIEDRHYQYDEELSPHTPKYGYEDEHWNVVEYKHKDPNKPKRVMYDDGEMPPEDYEQNADIMEYDN